MLAWYRFGEGAAGSTVASLVDSGPNAVNGTVVTRSPVLTYSSDIPNAAAGPFSLNATGDGGSATVSDRLSFLRPASSFTLEAYVKPSANYSGSNNDADFIVLMKSAEAGSAIVSYGLQYSSVSGTFAGLIDTDVDTNLGQTAVISSAVTPGSWYHLALVFTDNGTTDSLALYVNHVLQQSVSGNFNIYYDTGLASPFVIGAANFLGDPSGPFRRNFGGLIDEVRLSDTALTPSGFLPPVPEPAMVSGLAVPLLALRRRGRARRVLAF